MNIDPVTEGALAKNNKLNEVIKLLNSIAGMEVREGAEGDTVGLTISDNQGLLITTAFTAADDSDDGDDSDLLSGYVEKSVILCDNGSPVNGSILFKAS